MRQPKASKRTQKKKAKSKSLIRTDVWDLKATLAQKKLMQLTIIEYRRFLFPLVIIINAQWQFLATLTDKERVNWVEKAIHVTSKNSNPKYKYYQKVIEKYPSFRKFPSYLRRAAIAEALGIVSSFQSRYREWQSGMRQKRKAQAPSLTARCKSYPALYKGQQIKYYDNYQAVELKIWDGKDWCWSQKIPIKRHGLNRHLTVENELKSPALVVNRRTCQLSMPVKIAPVKKEESDDVCAVDLGINNAATCSIVGKDGTVKARKFINPARDIDRRNKRRMMIARKSKQTYQKTEERFSKGFCRGLYRKSNNINLEIARQVVREIIEFAQLHQVKVIVMENLAGWKAKAGKKGSLMKQKFHLWCHRKIVELITDKWTELGGEVQTVNPKYTSAVAFDGSGKVRRSLTNYSLALFKN